MHIVISGATGLIGTALTVRLARAGHRVTGLVRDEPGAGQVRWNPAAGMIPDGTLEGVDAVVNLAGAGINDHRWTDEYKRLLLDSRISSTDTLVAAIGRAAQPPKVLVSGSAIGYYGPRGDEVLDEHAAPGDTFLAEVCVKWEAAAARARESGVRVALVRTGIVLTPKGGALKKQLPLFKFGLGGKFGSGAQWQSWISLDDEVGAIVHLLEHDLDGAFNLTAPETVTNATFTSTLGRVLRRPTVLPIPNFGPRLLLGGELAEALLFTGQRVVPVALQESGYGFGDPLLEDALRSMLA